MKKIHSETNLILWAVVKVIEIMSNSPKNWEDAAMAVVKDNKITEHRITAKLSFELE